MEQTNAAVPMQRLLVILNLLLQLQKIVTTNNNGFGRKRIEYRVYTYSHTSSIVVGHFSETIAAFCNKYWYYIYVA